MAGRDPEAAGHFTTLQVRGGRVQGRDLHVDRLRQASLRMYGTAPGADTLRSSAREALAAAGMDEGDCTLRIRIHAVGDARLQVDIDIQAPRHASPHPLRVRAHPGPRALPEVKHLALDHQLEARRAAQEAGCDDAVFVTADGSVAEGTFWNIAFWDGEAVTWPEGPALAGVTLSLLREALADAAITQRSIPVRLDAIGAYRAAFALNSTGIQDIVAIDGHVFSGDARFGACLRALLAVSPWERF